MAYEDVLGRALDEADNKGTIDYGNPESVQELTDFFGEIAFDEEGNPLDHFPSAEEVGRENWGDWIDFLNHFDLWDEFREDWERDYEETT